MRKLFPFLVLFCIVVNSSSQNFTRPGEWKKFRKEVFFCVGASEFLGDLGGRDRIGTDFSPVDIDFELTKTSWGLGYRYKLQKWLNWTTRFGFCKIQGDDKLTKETFRHERNLNFKSNVFDLTTRIEVGWEQNKAGNRYGIKKTLNRRMKNNRHSLYLFAGIGGLYFNPKGRLPSGLYRELRPLHTEGQGLPNGPKQYRRIALCIPLGIYYKFIINKQYTFGLELGWYKTFTDYIDDVSTRYYDKNMILAKYGSMAAYFADPNLGNIPGFSSPNGEGLAAQRGDKEKDSYITLQVTLGYVFKQKRKRARLRSKF